MHRAGKQHGNVDALSRMPRPCLASSWPLRQEAREDTAEDTAEAAPCVCEINPVQEDSLAEITELPAMRDQQMADVNIACIIKWLEANHRPDRAEVAAYSEETKVYWGQWDTRDERWSAIPSLGIISRHSAQVAVGDTETGT